MSAEGGIAPDTTSTHGARQASEQAESRHVGDRLGAFAALLPARPDGPVALAVGDQMAEALLARFPDAVVLAPGPTPLLDAGALGLLVVDCRLFQPRSLAPALRPGATLVTIGRRGRFVLYPDTEHPEHVWTRGWPTPTMSSPRAQVRRVAGLRLSALRASPRIQISGAPFVSLADEIGRELGEHLGEPLELVGLATAGHTILRFRGSRDYAVRLSCTDPDGEILRSRQAAREVPQVRALVPDPLLTGRTRGHPWVATHWIAHTGCARWRPGATQSRRWEVAEKLAARLEARPTGCTGPGWALAWVAAVPLVPEPERAAFVDVLETLDEGIPTGWSHGDLWPGNILFDDEREVVIDWDNAARDAPLGLDWLMIAALRIVVAERGGMAQACARLVDEPELVQHRVAGRTWHLWDRQSRIRLVVAGFLLYLRNRALHDLGQDALDRNLEQILLLARSMPGASAERTASAGRSREPARSPGRSGPVSGTLWFGLGSLVVKASQTVVLLLLARLLAPSALGVLAVGALVLNVTSAVTDLGTSTALVHWRGDVERAARSALSLALGLSAAVVVGGWLLAPVLAAALDVGQESAGVIRGLLLALPFLAVSGVSRELMRRKMAFARRVLPDIVAAVVGAALAISLALQGHGVYSLVAGQVLDAGLCMVLCWVVHPPVRLGWRRSDVGRLIGYGRHLAGAELLQLVMLNLDYLVVARVLGPRALGEYSLAFRLAYMPFLMVAVVIGGVAFPYLCRLRGNDLGRASGAVAVITMTAVLPLYLGELMLAPQLGLLGEKWEPAVVALRWLCLYGLALSMVRVCEVPLKAAGATRDVFRLNLLHLGLLAAVLAALAGRGIGAVAIGQCLASACVAVVAMLVVRRRLSGLVWGDWARPLLPSAAGALLLVITVLLTGLGLPWQGPSVPGLSILIAGGALAYAVPVWLLTGRSLQAMLPLRSGGLR